LPRSIGALGTRGGTVAMCLLVLGGRGDSGGLPSGRALAVVGSFHHLEPPQGAPRRRRMTQGLRYQAHSA
jgi:hypothetical protein